MKQHRYSVTLLVVVLLYATLLGQSPGVVNAGYEFQGMPLTRPSGTSPLAALGTGFTYQGQLQQGGSRVI